ncbi:MAG: HEPN domain-containing protein [Mesorhizobium sp.]|uniref:nucleotidyltransferase and HEPN domain-containing protein n=1 Tax=Mesorhizobium sp. TaxID=1871066 RepID=UPI000FE8DA34|nr:nucleotidyltransferase and HEPN domain-containing protein [Mesorhizobium sp.]RWI49108.1 MAG: HEPN domain-containing protein [Mesorhizobium sp.]
MKSSIDHLPPAKQRELKRAVEVLLEEFDDALKEGTADFKKRGRILKVILFGSYARGDWVDEPHTTKGYRSDFDLLIVVNNRRLTDFAGYWQTAADRLMREVSTPVSFIVHSRREVNTALREGQYFFVDIRRDGIVLYELDQEPLAEPRPMSAVEEYKLAKEHFEKRFRDSRDFAKGAAFYLSTGNPNLAAFSFHQSIEQAYSSLLLVLTNYSPPSHNIKFLRSLAEDQVQQLAEVWPRDQQRFVARFNVINEAYVKARYSKHFEISNEALTWLSERVTDLIDRIEKICQAQLEKLNEEARLNGR